MPKKVDEISSLKNLFRQTLAPLILIISFTNIAVCLVYLVVIKQSNMGAILQDGLLDFITEAWRNSFNLNWSVVTLITGMTIWSALSLLVLDGKVYYGPYTPSGHRPKYVQSGVKYYVLTMIVAIVLLSRTSAWYWYRLFPTIITHLIVFGYGVVILLYLKGRVSPSPGDYGSSGSAIFDFYWGLELYPRLGEWFDVKQWTNCRFGMMVMQLTVLLCWKAQIETSGWNWAMAVSSTLQTIYLAKFYWWESGYMNTVDIIVDRAGFYICWGCLCIVPSFYTLTILYMVENSPELRFTPALLLLLAGLTSIGLNYWTDYQKQLVLETQGNCTIWNSPPVLIRTTYKDATGKNHSGILLASGFWGIARHINYVFEILLHLFWELPSLFNSVLPYVHGIFVTILLIHRTHRDDQKCRAKYGEHWKKYCQLCPYKMAPGIF